MKRLTLSFCWFALSIGQVLACCMVPAGYAGRIGQDAQEALIVHDGHREELVLRINYKIEGAKMPESFAWVITVPNEPDAYAVADPDLFEKMDKLAKLLLAQTPRYSALSADQPFSDGNAAVPQGVELGKAVTVGPYAIQPIRGVGSNALLGLNTWLNANGFPSENPEHMRYFVESNFTFLCVKIKPEGGSSLVPSSGVLPPLHLSFASKRPYYPLKFSSQQGEFDLNLHILTKQPVDFKAIKKQLKSIAWSNSGYKKNYKLHHTSVPKVLGDVLKKGKIQAKQRYWNYSNIQCLKLNKGKSLERLESDVFFELKPINSPLGGFKK